MSFAYIDPATGAMVLQVIVAAVLATGVFFRKFFLLPFAFLFRRNRSEDAAVTGDDSAERENA